MKRLAGLVVFMAIAAAPATAYRIDRHVVPQPTLRYFVGLPDWRKPFDRAVKDLNRKHVGVQLRKAQIPEQATIQVGRLEHACGLPGVDGTTLTIKGGYAAIYLPRGCRGKIASIIAAHELGHALGLKHEDRRCALLNSSGTGPNGIPTRCVGRRFDWLRHPYRKDDIAGLRRLYRNTRPTARLRVAKTTGATVTFEITAKDKQRNISELTIDFGDGSKATGFRPGELPHSHSYASPGTYTARLTVIDLYLRRATATVEITV